MSFCNKCGFEVTNGKFCPRCGAPVNQPSGFPTNQPSAPYERTYGDQFTELPPTENQGYPPQAPQGGYYQDPAQTGYPQQYPQNAYPQNPYPQNNGYSQNNGYPQPNYQPVPPQKPPKKKNTLMIVIVILLCLAIAAVAGVLVYFFVIAPNNDSSSSSSSAVSGTEATAIAETQDSSAKPDETKAETQKPTDAPTDAPTVSKIMVGNYKNKSFETVKKDLEKKGVKIKKDEAFSDTVAKGNIISHSPVSTEVEAGDTVTFIVSKGSSKSPESYSQKVVLEAASGSSSATMTLYTWSDGEWKQEAKFNAMVGKDGISYLNSENNSYTPAGTHDLGVILATSDPSVKGARYYHATNDTCVIDDPNSSGYNQITEFYNIPDGVHYDPIGHHLTSDTTAMIYINHNGDGLSPCRSRGDSSAITICGMKRALEPTYGCVDISASDMEILLSKLDYTKKPVIIIQTK